MQLVYEIGDLTPQHLGSTISVRGTVVAKSIPIENNISIKLMEIAQSNLPKFIVAKGDFELFNPISIRSDVVVTGRYSILQKRGKHIQDLAVIEAQEIIDFEKDKVNMFQPKNIENEHDNVNIFQDAILDTLRFKNSTDFIDFLVRKGYQQGFKLVSQHNKNAEYISLRCDRYQSNDLAKKCEFQICLQSHKYKTEQQYYTISKRYLNHSHNLDPLLFAHLLIDKKTKEFMQILHGVNVNNQHIAAFVKKISGIELSSRQISSIVNSPVVSDNMKAESEVLKENVLNNGGTSFCLDAKENTGKTYRLAIATFTKIEMENLHKFGDFISIDPTYVPLSSQWTLVPISVVGRCRELRSGGCIFASSITIDVYQFILDLLINRLPCQGIIRTICSDDDIVLDAAFKRIENDPFVISINRVICIWHKMSQFKDIVNSSIKEKDQRSHAMEIFHEMVYTRSKKICKENLEKLKKINDRIRIFIETSIEHRLITSTKAFTKNVWTLGYLTSIFAECSNSRIKSFLGRRALSLSEMREIISFSDDSMQLNRRYIKGRKIRKAIHPDIIKIMNEYEVDQRIAEAILGSKLKASRLILEKNEGYYLVKDPKTNETFKVSDSLICKCGKLTSTGIPCSHMFAVASFKNIEIGSEHISERWKLNSQEMNRSIIEHVEEHTEELKQSYLVPLSCKQRYLEIKAKIASLADIACRKNENFEELMSVLTKLENKFLGITDDVIIDAQAKRPGRHRISRIKREGEKKVKKCIICGSDHATKTCIHKDEIQQFVHEDDIDRGGKKHCAACGVLGHNAKRCQAIIRWKNSTMALSKTDS